MMTINQKPIIISLQRITKNYRLGELNLPVLKGIDLNIAEGEYLSIMGASGSGKSTLMNIMGCLDRATKGDYFFEGRNLTTFNNEELAFIRNQKIGFVFQQFNLLSRYTALENVMLPMIYAHIPKAKRRQRATQLLHQVGLGNYLNHLPQQLSGGQQQRVAIARALINRPVLILADEPTGALDSNTSGEVMNLLTFLNQQGITIVIITHDQEIANQTNRIIQLKDGLVVKNNMPKLTVTNN
jgi:putative ABC transport system ATP-binding protein